MAVIWDDESPTTAPGPTSPSSPTPAQATPPPSNMIAQWKQALTQEPPKGTHTRFGETDLPGRVVRALGDVVVPGSWPGAISLAASMVPGGGLLGSLARTGAAMTTSAGVEAARGSDPLVGAGEAALYSVPGEVAGAVGRAATRGYRALRDSAYPRKLGEALERVLPVIKGQTPEHTVENVFSGEAQRLLGQEYGRTIKALYATHGDPPIAIGPSARQLLGLKRNVATASELEHAIDGVERSLHTVTGDFSRRRAAFSEEAELRVIKQDLEQRLARTWPPDALAARRQLDRKYAEAKEVLRAFGQGREKVKTKGLLEPGGALNTNELQRRVMERWAALRSRVPQAEILKEAIRRGEPKPLVTDEPGRSLSFGGHMTPFGGTAYLRHLPRSPRLIGASRPDPEEIARILRAAGVLGTEHLVNP